MDNADAQLQNTAVAMNDIPEGKFGEQVQSMETIGEDALPASNTSQSKIFCEMSTKKEKVGPTSDGRMLVPRIILERIDIKKFNILPVKNGASTTDNNFVGVPVKEEFLAEEDVTTTNVCHSVSPVSQNANQVSQSAISSCSLVNSDNELNSTVSGNVVCKTEEIRDPKSVLVEHFEGASRVKEENEDEPEESFDEHLNNKLEKIDERRRFEIAIKEELEDEFEVFFREHLKKVARENTDEFGENDENENQFIFSKDDELVGLKNEELIFDDCYLTESEICANDDAVAQCLAELGRKNGLRKNSRPRTYNYPYACDRCPDKFRFLKDFNQHLKKHKYCIALPPSAEIDENDKNENQFVFPTYQEFVGLKTEEPSYEEFSSTEAEIYANDATTAQCLEESSRRSALRKKLKPRTYNYPYACDRCPDKFRFLKDLNRHSKVHKNVVSSSPCSDIDENGSLNSLEWNFDKFSSTVTEICSYADTAQSLAESIRKSVLRKKLKLRTSKEYIGEVSQADPEHINDDDRNQRTSLSNYTPSSLRNERQNFDEPKSDCRSVLRKKLKPRTYNYPFACDMCPEKFRFLKNLHQHSKEHRGKISRKISRVLTAKNDESENQFLPSAKVKLVHLESEEQNFDNFLSKKSEIFAHNNNAVKFLETSRRGSFLRKQSKARTYNYPYTCDRCSEKFRFLKDLNRHSKEHNGDVSCVKIDENGGDRNQSTLAANDKSTILENHQPGFDKFSKSDYIAKALSLAESNSQSFLRKQLKPRTYNYPYACDQCSDKFRFLKDLNQHLEDHNGDVPCVAGLAKYGSEQKSYSCSECPLKFQSLGGLRRHTYVHKDKGLDAKKAEDLQLDSKKRRQQIKFTRSPAGIYTCAHCSVKSKWKSVLIRHQELHSDNKISHECKVCHRRFRHLRSYKRHATVHSDEKPFRCPYCPVKLKQMRSYRKHLLKHSENSVSRFSRESSFNSVSDMLKDPLKLLPGKQRNRSKDPSKKPFQCKHCSSRFTQRADVGRHIADVHASDWEYQCQECPRTFFHLSSLKRHLQSHLEVDQYKCEICPATFNEKRLLKNHLLSHFNGKWFTCTDCSVRFKQKSHLQAHLKSGCADEPTQQKSDAPSRHIKGFITARKRYFSCAHCPAKFSTKSSLQEHLLTYSHTNLKQHKCIHCPKKFWTRRMLKHHIQTHVETSPD